MASRGRTAAKIFFFRIGKLHVTWCGFAFSLAFCDTEEVGRNSVLTLQSNFSKCFHCFCRHIYILY